jgi:hypothetical protein
MGYKVTEAKYRTCICGKVCKGSPALGSHSKKCHAARVQSAMFMYCVDERLDIPSGAAIMANLDALTTALTEKGYLK